MYWFGAIMKQAITWATVDPGVYRYIASLGHKRATAV